jgi:hypothetical protein
VQIICTKFYPVTYSFLLLIQAYHRWALSLLIITLLTVLDEAKDWEEQFVPFLGASRLLGSPVRVKVDMTCET